MALAVAFPFLFSYTQPPSTNFWPLMAAGLCGWVVAVVWNARSAGRVNTVRGGWMDRSEMATWLGAGLLLAAVLASAIGLLQYFGAAPGLDPWVHTAKPGQAMGNLRQRNQQATLLSMGLWALLWVVAQTEAHLRASSAGGSSAQAGADLHGGGRPWPLWLVGILTAWALALLAVGSAATASRTGLAQLLVILVLLALWRASVGRVALGLVLAGLAIYAVAAWLLPNLLLQWTGFRAEGLFARFGDAPGCTSRRVLWSNVLHLIAQKPWLGWGWGELDYAHYMTLFPGERFCVLLDNAHNLPLHLAVELGLPAALLLCGGVLAWLVWSRPWRETDPVRQLAWGVVAVVGLHSLLEYPLWYGPFQVTTLFALVLLCWRRAPGRGVPEAWRWLGSRLGDVNLGWGLGAAVCLIGAAGLGMAAYQYRVVSQLYKPVAQRPPALRDVRAVPQPKGVLFSDQVRFAWLTTQDLTPANAAQMHAVALDLLHFSPEPRVIEKVVDGAQALGRADEAALHQQRYRIAYPADFARWQARRASAASAAGAQ